VEHQVFIPLIVGGKGAVEIINATATIAVMIDHDHQSIIRNIGGNISQPAVVIGQKITIRAK